MPRLIVVDREGRERAIEGEAGLSVMEVIRDDGFDEMLALCGCCCACGTCHVYVDEEWLDGLPAPARCEDELLDMADERRAGSRLSCRISFEAELDGMHVTIAPE